MQPADCAPRADHFFSCQCHFLKTTGRTPANPNKKFTPKQLASFVRSCEKQFGGPRGLRKGCLKLAKIKKFNQAKAARAVKAYSKRCIAAVKMAVVGSDERNVVGKMGFRGC